MAHARAVGACLDTEAWQQALRRLGHERFRPGQREAIETLLSAGALLLVAPTGGGKSLTYQLPALVLEGTSIVVSPLVALMHDQVERLQRCGVRVTYLASTLAAEERRRRERQIRAGAFDLVYVAPERLSHPGFRRLVEVVSPPLVAVDEAHCISEWGHDFRPDYRRIHELLALCPDARVLACTATATPVVRDDILAQLGLPPDTPQMLRGFARPNLALAARHVSGPREATGWVDRELARALGGPGAARGAAIVYAPTRRRAEQEASRLRCAGWRTGLYHAGRDGAERAETQTAFAGGTLDVVVATNAFGMGIDRADVRSVIHLAPPASLEAYYQEVGRAGRDGLPASGLLLLSDRDIALRRRLIARPDEEGREPPAERVEHRWALFLELLRWAESGSCRHDAILRYFGDEDETLDGCGRCDNCERLASGAATGGGDSEEVTLIVRKALSAVARVHGRFGLGAAVRLLQGRTDPRLQRSGLDRTRTFGILSDRSETWLQALLRRCVTAGWVGFSGERRPVAMLTESGRAVMAGRHPARLLLPEETGRRRSPRRTTARDDDEARLDPEQQRLFERLRVVRGRLARARRVPPYVVASDRTLREIARRRPRTLDELAGTYGIGAARLAAYGPDLLVALQSER